jgi:hypothetical protein
MREKERRRHARVILPWTVRGTVDRQYDVQVIDLSMAGAMIEHAERFQPGEIRLLFLWVPGADLCLRAQLIWCQMSRMQMGAGGKGELRFRSGVHFPQLNEADEAHLQRYLATFNVPDFEPAQAEDASPDTVAPSSTASSSPQGPGDRLHHAFFKRSR